MLKISGTTVAVLLSVGVAIGGFAPSAQAKSFNLVHSFAGATGDGDDPKADVAFDNAGNLYGTTYNGGTSNNGTIYKIDVHGTETLLHSFDGSGGGADGAAGVTIDENTGDLYGVTQAGGTSGAGTLYKLAANGTFTVLHSFTNTAADGGYPQWRMIADKQGNLYGVTQSGGASGYGILFKYSANGNYTVLYNFDSTSASPTGRLALDSKGNLYGVNGTGGTSSSCSGHGCGAIYELAANGTFVTLYSFTNGDDGHYPVGGLTIDKKGNLFGTTGYGGASDAGTVFELAVNREFVMLFSFNNTNGNSPVGEVLELKKDLYVTTYGGGTSGLGTVVKISLKGVGKVLHNFTGDDGKLPIAGLVERKPFLYGTTSAGGANGHGTVFSLKEK